MLTAITLTRRIFIVSDLETTDTVQRESRRAAREARASGRSRFRFSLAMHVIPRARYMRYFVTVNLPQRYVAKYGL
jgi:hypothetical protein